MPGGVCAVLDYDVELMAEYVSEMATRLVEQAQVTPAFRKFVSQILTSTRLPSTTILLGMNYLSKRINMLKVAHGTIESHAKDGHVWRMLTIALLLGSKFLDDNTFQNRSWSEVSGLPVADLNKMEGDWLRDIGWCLYVNLDYSKDYNAWLKSWQEWQENKKRQAQQPKRHITLSIDTDVTRPRHSNAQIWQGDYGVKRNDYAPPQTYGTRDGWQQYHNPWSQPLSPPDSGYGTPEYASSATASAGYNDWFSQAASSAHFSRAFQSSSSQPGYHQTARPNSHYQSYYHGNHYAHGVWENGVMECNCINCSPQKPSYFMAHSHMYGQPVAG